MQKVTCRRSGERITGGFSRGVYRIFGCEGVLVEEVGGAIKPVRQMKRSLRPAIAVRTGTEEARQYARGTWLVYCDCAEQRCLEGEVAALGGCRLGVVRPLPWEFDGKIALGGGRMRGRLRFHFCEDEPCDFAQSRHLYRGRHRS